MNLYWVVADTSAQTEYRQTRVTVIISQKVTRVTSHHLYYSMCLKCPPPARTPLANGSFNNCVTSAFYKVMY